MSSARPHQRAAMPNCRSDAGPSTGQDLALSLIAKSFALRDEILYVGGFNVKDLAAQYGTPLFLYDAEVMRQTYRSLNAAVGGFAQLFYSVKANPNLHIIKVFSHEGAGAEIASGAEFDAARAAGIEPGRILFAGPGKSDADLAHVVAQGIGEIHLENIEELRRVSALGVSHGRRVPVAIRINPSALAQGGAMRMGGRPSQFGFDEEDLDAVVDAVRAEPGLELTGIHLFTGTQILAADTIVRQWTHALSLARRVGERLGQPIATIDLGGGLGIPYFEGDLPLDLSALAEGARQLKRVMDADPWLRNARIVLEPGRFLVGSSGLYVVRVRAVKHSRGARFVITDGGMHHHLSASGNLGQVFKRDFPVIAVPNKPINEHIPTQVVGPLCTPLDVMARATPLPALGVDDLVIVLQSGAYALTASPNNFLSHPRPPEVIVDNGKTMRIDGV